MEKSRADIEALNFVFENYLHDYLSKTDLQTIAQQFGPEIAEQAETLFDAAMSCPVDWKTANVDDGLLILSQFLAQESPWLSQEARYKFNAAFFKAWK